MKSVPVAVNVVCSPAGGFGLLGFTTRGLATGQLEQFIQTIFISIFMLITILSDFFPGASGSASPQDGGVAIFETEQARGFQQCAAGWVVNDYSGFFGSGLL